MVLYNSLHQKQFSFTILAILLALANPCPFPRPQNHVVLATMIHKMSFFTEQLGQQTAVVQNWQLHLVIANLHLGLHMSTHYPVCSLASRAGNSLLCSSLICSFAHFAQIKWATVSDSLRSLKTNKRPWANYSGCSEERSHRERISQVAWDKWATISNLLRSLRGNERMSDSLKKKSKILF